MRRTAETLLVARSESSQHAREMIWWLQFLLPPLQANEERHETLASPARSLLLPIHSFLVLSSLNSNSRFSRAPEAYLDYSKLPDGLQHSRAEL